MFKTLAIAAFASTMALAAPISSAEAKTNFDFNFDINLGNPGGYSPGYYSPYPVYAEPVYVNYCGAARVAVKHQGFKKVQIMDCTGPTYGFKAKRHGNWYYVRTNVHGRIKTVELL